MKVNRIILTIFIVFLSFLPLSLATVKVHGDWPFFHEIVASVYSSTITREFTAYPEECLKEGEVFVQQSFVLGVDGQFGIKSVKINGKEVSVVEKIDGECKSELSQPNPHIPIPTKVSKCRSARFLGKFPMSIIKPGKNQITIEYYTPCTNPINFLNPWVQTVCSAGELAQKTYNGYFNLISAEIRNVKELPSNLEIYLLDSDHVTLDTGYHTLYVEAGKPFKFQLQHIYFGGVKGGTIEDIFRCFENAGIKL